MKTLSKLIMVGCLMGISAQAALAATQGDLEAATDGSTATSTITLTTEEYAQINSVENVTFGTYDAAGGLGLDSTTTNTVCVYTNDPLSKYKVTASGNYDAAGAAGTGFFVKHGTSADTIPYTVKWIGDAVGPAVASLTATTQSAAITGASAAYPCAGDNAMFRVELTHSDIMDQPAGAYTGILTLVVVPDNT